MNSTVLCILILLLVLASNYCCYRMGRSKGMNDGIKRVIRNQICVAPDLYRQIHDRIKEANNALDDEGASHEMVKKMASNVINFMLEEMKKEG